MFAADTAVCDWGRAYQPGSRSTCAAWSGKVTDRVAAWRRRSGSGSVRPRARIAFSGAAEVEGAGGLAQIRAGGAGSGVSERVEEFPDADELGGGLCVVAGAECRCRALGREGGGAAGGSGLRTAGGGFDGAGGGACAEAEQGEVRGKGGTGEPDRLAVAVAVGG
jgi:hypothetical protein